MLHRMRIHNCRVSALVFVLAVITIGKPPALGGDQNAPPARTGSAPPNDLCFDALPINGQGSFAFDNAGELTTRTRRLSCPGSGHTRIVNDLWYCWTAPCDGEVTIDTCGTTTVDTKLAVYSGCACPSSDEDVLACNDDACLLQSSLTFSAQAGGQYMIEVGTSTYADDAQSGGSGRFTITCGAELGEPCDNPDENCRPSSRWNALSSNRIQSVVATAFTPETDAPVTQVCWWGGFFDGDQDCALTATRQQTPDFEIRYYSDAGGLPGNLLAGPFRESDGSLALNGAGRTGHLIAEVMKEYRYRADHAPVAVDPGQRYWMEITSGFAAGLCPDDTDGQGPTPCDWSDTDWTPAEYCSWYWSTASPAHGQAVQDGDGTGKPDGYDPGDLTGEAAAFCLNVPLAEPPADAPPPNDYCADALVVTDGATPFTTLGATTDGAEELTCGFLVGDDSINQDIWFDYEATCTGVLTVNLADSLFDTKVAVYEGTACLPTNPPIGCHDDLGGPDALLASQLAVPVTQGQVYKIRIGGYTQSAGAGTMSITCGEPPLNDDCASAPIESLPHTFMSDLDHATNQCDAFAGPHVWTAFELPEAASLTIDFCGTGGSVQAPYRAVTTDCSCADVIPSSYETPCANGNVKLTWDCLPAGVYYYPIPAGARGRGTFNVTMTESECFVPCDGTGGDCVAANDDRGCNDPTCCLSICAADPYCCETRWDGLCAAEAKALCSTRPVDVCQGAEGDCFDAHDTGGCEDLAICRWVCTCDPFCCAVYWDENCAGRGYLAESGCGGASDCNANSIADDEDIADGTSTDCDGNGFPDECEDCNGNGLSDACDFANGTVVDCNGNARPDSCDIDLLFSDDCNGNGVPDECEVTAKDVLTFETHEVPRPETFPLWARTIGDWNLDGYGDIAVLTEYGKLWVYFGSADATFGDGTAYDSPVYGEDSVITPVDVDADGDLDLVVTEEFHDGWCAILNNDGTGAFSDALELHSGNEYTGVAGGDLDGDGHVDLVFGEGVFTEEGYIANMPVLLGRGDGLFRERLLIPESMYYSHPRVADMNGDGLLDVVASEYDRIGVFLNRGARMGMWQGLAPPREFYVDQNISRPADSLMVADVTGNGYLDVLGAAPEHGLRKLLLMPNLGAASDGSWKGLSPPTPQYFLPHSSSLLVFGVDVGDVDGDADLDFALFGTNYSNIDYETIVLLNNGVGGVGTRIQYGTGAGPTGLALADMDADGDVDMVATTATIENRNEVYRILVYRNRGNGMFHPDGVYTTSVSPGSLALADFNGDTIADVAVADSEANAFAVSLNRGNGELGGATTYLTGGGPEAIHADDIDKDTDVDLIIANAGDDTISIYSNDGAATFTETQVVATCAHPTALETADFDGDGDTDAAVACLDDNSVTIVLNDGLGGFAVAGAYGVGTGPAAVAAGDLDGDGDADLAVANAVSGSVYALRNIGAAEFRYDGFYQSAGTPVDLLLNDVDHDGDLDIVTAAWSLTAFFNTGNAIFVGMEDYGVSGYGVDLVAIASADLNGDGHIDLAALSHGEEEGSTVTVLLTDQDGNLATNCGCDRGCNCFWSRQYTAGCNDPECEAKVCARSPSCCTTAWYWGYDCHHLALELCGCPDSVELESTEATIPGRLAVTDFDADGIADVLSGWSHLYRNLLNKPSDDDCNKSGTPDACDGPDENANAIPDACEPDCNENGIPDDIDIATGGYADTNDNLIPDVCEADCDGDGIFDADAIASCPPKDPACADCNSNGIPDGCDIAGPLHSDCDANGIPDKCEPQADCNDNDVLDICDIADGTAEDCNGNRVLDQCEFTATDVVFSPPARTTINDWRDDRRVQAIAIGEFNGDGYADVAAASNTGLFLLLNDGRGVVPTEAQLGDTEPSRSVVTYDLNNDRSLDLIVVRDTGVLSILLATGAGTFADELNIALAEEPASIRGADLDGDTFVDLILVNEIAGTATILLNQGNDTDGAWLGLTTAEEVVAGVAPSDVAAGDFDWDGDLDLAFADSDEFYINIVANRGRASGHWLGFGESRRVTALQQPSAIVAADFDDDAHTDLVVAGLQGTVAILQNSDGQGTFPVARSIFASGFIGSLFAANLDDDGDTDLIVATGGPSGMRAHTLSNTGDGWFGEPERLYYADGPASMDVGDLNADDLSDIAMLESGRNLLVLHGYATKPVSRDCNRNGAIDECENLGGGDFNGDGSIDSVDGGAFADCLAGSGGMPQPRRDGCAPVCLEAFDTDGDGDIDISDFAAFQTAYGGVPSQ